MDLISKKIDYIKQVFEVNQWLYELVEPLDSLRPRVEKNFMVVKKLIELLDKLMGNPKTKASSLEQIIIFTQRCLKVNVIEERDFENLTSSLGKKIYNKSVRDYRLMANLDANTISKDDEIEIMQQFDEALSTVKELSLISNNKALLNETTSTIGLIKSSITLLKLPTQKAAELIQMAGGGKSSKTYDPSSRLGIRLSDEDKNSLSLEIKKHTSGPLKSCAALSNGEWQEAIKRNNSNQGKSLLIQMAGGGKSSKTYDPSSRLGIRLSDEDKNSLSLEIKKHTSGPLKSCAALSNGEWQEAIKRNNSNQGKSLLIQMAGGGKSSKTYDPSSRLGIRLSDEDKNSLSLEIKKHTSGPLKSCAALSNGEWQEAIKRNNSNQGKSLLIQMAGGGKSSKTHDPSSRLGIRLSDEDKNSLSLEIKKHTSGPLKSCAALSNGEWQEAIKRNNSNQGKSL